MRFFATHECNPLNIYQNGKIPIWKLQVGMKHAFYVQCTFTTNVKIEKQRNM